MHEPTLCDNKKVAQIPDPCVRGISVSHPDIDGMAIGKHPVIMQGIYHFWPQQPRYKFVWNVRIVVRHIEAMPPSEKLPLILRNCHGNWLVLAGDYTVM